MIAHIILFSPRSDLPPEARRELLAAVTAASTGIPSIRRFRVGRRVRHGLPGYEQMMRDDYEFAAVIEFDDVAALKAYLSHPSHAAIGRHFTASASKSLAYDYVMVDAGEAALLPA
jgi:hypothetical protein